MVAFGSAAAFSNVFADAVGMKYLVRQYVEGVGLHEQVTVRGPFSPDRVREAALSLCRLQQYPHSQNPLVIWSGCQAAKCSFGSVRPLPSDRPGRCTMSSAEAAGRHRVPGNPGHRAGAVRLSADRSVLRPLQHGDPDALFAAPPTRGHRPWIPAPRDSAVLRLRMNG